MKSYLHNLGGMKPPFSARPSAFNSKLPFKEDSTLCTSHDVILWRYYGVFLHLNCRKYLRYKRKFSSIHAHKNNTFFPAPIFTQITLFECIMCRSLILNPLTPNDPYSGRTAPLTSKRCILYIYSTNIGTEYFKHGIYSPFSSLKNAVCFIILTYLVPVLFTLYIQGVLKLK